jgi:nucleoside-diphosphate-sugar epimerase
MNVLITGITGFVGVNLTDFLNRNTSYSIFGLDITKPYMEGVDHIWDWEELNKIRDIDVVIHLAGKAHDLKGVCNDREYIDVNYGLTKVIFEWYISSKANKFIFISSVKAIADKLSGELTEDFTPDPVTAYGKSKLMAEEYIRSIEMDNIDKKVYIFRPAMIYGNGNKGNLNLLYSVINRGIPWMLGSFDNKRSYLSVDNLSFVLNKFIDKNIDSGTFNISDDDPISTNELVKIISKAVNIKCRFWFIPRKIIIVLAKLGDIFCLPLTSERLQKLTETYVVSNKKLNSVLKEPLPVSSKSGLYNTIKNFKEKNL